MTLMTGHCWYEEIMPRIKRGTDPLGTAPAYRQPSGTERHSWPEFPTSGYRRRRRRFGEVGGAVSIACGTGFCGVEFTTV